MACTTVLVGKKASYNGSTLIARNDDSQSGKFTPKKMAVLKSQDDIYEAKLSKLKVELPKNFIQTTYVPNALDNEGIWGASGINHAHVAMTATETITTNSRVLAYDPYVEDGLGEEDIVSLVLPYIHSSKEGVLRLGQLLEQYGTYESNGIAFSDQNEIWFMETVGGHHWYARRVQDNEVVIMPNQLGLDELDFNDHENYLYSKDLLEFVNKHHLNLNVDGKFNPRLAFGSASDSDHTYNTPRRWILLKYFNKQLKDIHPEDDDLPYSIIPDRLITIEDIKEALSNHYQSTDYDVYGKYATKKGLYRPIGINRNDFLSCLELKKGSPDKMWITFGSNVFNAFTAFFTEVDHLPIYLTNTTENVDTHNFYWANRLIGALADAHFQECAIHIERYSLSVMAKTHALLEETVNLEKTNEKIASMLEKETTNTLNHVLYEASNKMKNAFSRSDA